MSKVYEIITEKIIEKLEKGVVPWHKPWKNKQAVNWVTQKPYRGVNILLLAGGEYATFNQIEKAGGKVKKGEESHIVVFWKMIESKKNNTGENESDKTKLIPMLRYYRVFEIGSQVEGLEIKRQDEEVFEHDPIQKAEEIKQGYVNPPRYTHVPGRATYNFVSDVVNVPPMKDFKKIEGYYSTLFHEIVHSTGHKNRLARPGITNLTASFGTPEYSREELVAEIGANFLNSHVGIENATIDNSASYIQSWLKVLKNDKKMVVLAAQQAQKACDYILGDNQIEE